MITLLIPTLNRSSFIIQYLQYLKNTGFRGCVCIGDSSESWHVERTRRFIRGLGPDFEISYLEYPGLGIVDCIHKLLPQISTPYAMYICDDDLLVPETVEQCMQFLDCNPDYSAATGKAMALTVASAGTCPRIIRAGNYRLRGIEDDTAGGRLTDLLNNYNVVGYSVSRTEQFLERWIANPNFSDTAFAVELFPCSLLAVQGKVKQFDSLFVGRQVHDGRYLMPDLFDQMTNPNWLPSYCIFRDRLIEELVRQDGISVEEAREVVKKAFWAYLAKHLSNRWQRSYGLDSAGLRDRLSQAARSIPGGRQVWNMMGSFKTGGRDGNLLPSLLRPSSRYHADFMPIYRAVVGSAQPEAPGNGSGD